MTTTLVIRSAATGAASASNAMIDAYLAAHPDTAVVERDLDSSPVPHINSESLAGIGREAPEGDEFAETRALQDKLIGEVFDADVIVIGLPLYNFGMPSTLKAWFDYIARSGTTFQYTESGSEGLVKGKRAVLLHARGGKYEDEEGFPFAIPHTKALLNFMGITDIEVVTAEGIAFGPDVAEAALNEAKAKIEELG
ncbi:FMN-dependent NADH-azoreductase [Novosphingobium aquimarinum]|uniref:FMN-dependent NADH-azoreductase n=1 Tax=Novosphingobium aquimarinum TaxID=2682494 RepID=UPI0012EB5F24|nr:NAD(P)H-dependent oxidoreductase [Novosphingobium aquimarinum]